MGNVVCEEPSLPLGVDGIVAEARRLAAMSLNPERVRHLVEAALLLAPDRLELHVELAALEVRAGRLELAEERMKKLGDEYSNRHTSVGEFIFSSSPTWEQDFEDWWTRSLGRTDSLSLEEQNRQRHRKRLFARYSIPTLRARARVRRDPSTTARPPELSLAESLRKLGGL